MATHPVPPGASPAKPPRVPPAPNSLAVLYQRVTPTPVIAAAEAFIAIGGRLMLSPCGQLEEAINLGLIFDPALAKAVAETNWNIVGTFVQGRRLRGAGAALKALVRRLGKPKHGWIVLEARS